MVKQQVMINGGLCEVRFTIPRLKELLTVFGLDDLSGISTIDFTDLEVVGKLIAIGTGRSVESILDADVPLTPATIAVSKALHYSLQGDDDSPLAGAGESQLSSDSAQ